MQPTIAVTLLTWLSIWTIAISDSVESTSDIPASLCVSGMDNTHLDKIYKYQDLGTIQMWINDFNNSFAIIPLNTTWYIVNNHYTHVYAYCTSVEKSKYPIHSSNQVGDPDDCDSWYPKGVKVTSDLNKGGCISFATQLEKSDGIWIGICSLIVFILVITMIPCFGKNKCQQKTCGRQNYDAVELETYKAILTLKNINPMSPRSTKDNRPVCEMLLKKDLILNKVAWYGIYKRDLLNHLRLNNMFFTMFYGSPIHPLRKKDRILIFLNVQILTIANLFIITYYEDAYLSNPLTTSEKTAYWIIEHFVDWLLSLSVVLIESIIVAASMCSCAEYTRKCIRHSCQTLGRLITSLLFVASLLYGYIVYLIVLSSFKEENFDETVDTSDFLSIFILRYIETQFRGIFIIGLIKEWFYFHRKWKKQTAGKNSMDEQNNNTTADGKKKRNNVKLFSHCNLCCVFSWLFCCFGGCICYYCCFIKKMKSKVYILDENGNVIGKNKKEFAITWVEYQCYKSGTELPIREYTRVARSIGSSIDLMTSEQLVNDTDVQEIKGVQMISLDDQSDHDLEDSIDRDDQYEYHHDQADDIIDNNDNK